MISFIIFISLVLGIMSYTSKWAGAFETLYGRDLVKERIIVRAYIAIPGFLSVLYHPFGAGDVWSNKYYSEAAERVGWIDRDGRAVAPHNHFAGLIIDLGIVGYFLMLALFSKLWKKIKYVRLSVLYDDWKIIVAGCITCIIHSLTHNGGFFTGDSPTLIIFGMLWSATAKTKYLKSNHDIINKVY